jgi:dethiobiotin synthetase
MHERAVFVSAIHTDSGKTLASAIICEAWGADYWKPVQAGSPYDADMVRALVSNPAVAIHPSAYVLGTPESPHAAAGKEGIRIAMETFRLPVIDKPLVIEGAGGCLVPLNDEDLVIDIPLRLQVPLILVSNFYLGSINHTLLSLEACKRRNIRIAGIIFNGKRNPDSERIILRHAQVPCLLHIDDEKEINREIVKMYAKRFAENYGSPTR